MSPREFAIEDDLLDWCAIAQYKYIIAVFQQIVFVAILNRAGYLLPVGLCRELSLV